MFSQLEIYEIEKALAKLDNDSPLHLLGQIYFDLKKYHYSYNTSFDIDEIMKEYDVLSLENSRLESEVDALENELSDIKDESYRQADKMETLYNELSEIRRIFINFSKNMKRFNLHID